MLARICTASSSSMRATGMPDLDRHDHRIAGILDGRKRADAAGDLLRNALQPQRDRGQDAERALGADEKPGQIVAGRRFPGATRRADFLAVRRHRRHGEHIVLHRAVAHGIGAGRPRRGHAADRGIGAGIDREEQAGIAQMDVQRFAGDARLDGAIEIARH